MEGILMTAVTILFFAELALFIGIVFREMVHYRKRKETETAVDSTAKAKEKK